jgi:hypothetical protein
VSDQLNGSGPRNRSGAGSPRAHQPLSGRATETDNTKEADRIRQMSSADGASGTSHTARQPGLTEDGQRRQSSSEIARGIDRND